jgi:hypothetical protein
MHLSLVGHVPVQQQWTKQSKVSINAKDSESLADFALQRTFDKVS